MQQCPTCGSGVPDNVDMCPDCGMDFQTATKSPPVQLPTPEPPLEVETATDDSSISPPSDNSVRTVAIEDTVLESSPLVTQALNPPQAAPTTSLILKRSGVLTDERFLLGKRSVVGRFDPDSGPVDVDLGPLPEASYVSRHHAAIFYSESGQWQIKDLGSRNGTFVRANSDAQFQRVSGEQTLESGYEVSLGNARFEFQICS